MARTKRGQAIRTELRTAASRRRLSALLNEAKRRGNLALWRRCNAVLGYLDGKTVIAMRTELDVARASINPVDTLFPPVDTLFPRTPPISIHDARNDDPDDVARERPLLWAKLLKCV